MPVTRRRPRAKRGRRLAPDVRLALILAAAVLGTLVRFAQTRPRAPAPPAHTDAIEYYRLGAALRTRGFLADPHRSWRPTAMRGLLYPSFVAATSGFARPGQAGVRWAQAGLGGVAVLLVGALGWAAFSPWCGVAAAGLLALDPRQIALAGQITIEGFYAFTLLVAALLFAAGARDKRSGWAAAAGLGLGLTLVCRSTLFALPAAAAVWRRRERGRAPWLLLGAYLLLIPWTVRNAYLFLEFQPFERGTATAAIVGASQGLAEGPVWREIDDAADAEHRREALKRIVTRPHLYLWGMLKRLPLLLYWLAAELGWLGLPLAAWGGWRGRKDPAMQSLLLLAGVFVATHLLIAPQRRYLFPLVPLLLVPTAAGLLAAVEKWRPSKWTKPEAADVPRPLQHAAGAGAALLCALYMIGVLATVREVREFAPGGGRLTPEAMRAGLGDVDQRLARMPESVGLLRERAELRGRLGDRAGAGADWQEVVRRAPHDIAAHGELARLLAADGRYGEALGVLDTAAARPLSGAVDANAFVWADLRGLRREIVRIQANDGQAKDAAR